MKYKFDNFELGVIKACLEDSLEFFEENFDKGDLYNMVIINNLRDILCKVNYYFENSKER